MFPIQIPTVIDRKRLYFSQESQLGDCFINFLVLHLWESKVEFLAVSCLDTMVRSGSFGLETLWLDF